MKPFAKVEPVIINYNGSKVKAKKLTVHSEISISIDTAWDNVKTPALLKFVAKGNDKIQICGWPFSKAMGSWKNLLGENACFWIYTIWRHSLFVH